jgi:hypothetical protein
MWTLLIILLVLLLLIIGFLVTPLVFSIDSDEQQIEVRQLPVIRFYVNTHTMKPHLHVLGFSLPLPAGKTKPKREKEKEQPQKRSKTGHLKKSWAAWRFLIQHIMNSFQIRRCVLLLDTDDVVLNAQLTPLFVLANRGPFTMQTNYNGRVYFHLEIINRPARLLWIFIQFLTKK